MTKCTTCGEELEYDAKFCTTCGAKVNNKVDIISNNKVAETTKSITSFVKSIGVFLVLLFVGFFVYTIFKVMFSLVFMVLINFNIVELTTYRSIKVLFILVSIFLAIIYTPKINKLKTMKAKIFLGILIVVLGTIGAVWISSSNMIARNNLVPQALTDSSLKSKNIKLNPSQNKCELIGKYGPENAYEETWLLKNCMQNYIP